MTSRSALSKRETHNSRRTMDHARWTRLNQDLYTTTKTTASQTRPKRQTRQIWPEVLEKLRVREATHAGQTEVACCCLRSGRALNERCCGRLLLLGLLVPSRPVGNITVQIERRQRVRKCDLVLITCSDETRIQYRNCLMNDQMRTETFWSIRILFNALVMALFSPP